MTLEIQVGTAWDRHKNVAGSNLFMGSQPLWCIYERVAKRSLGLVSTPMTSGSRSLESILRYSEKSSQNDTHPLCLQFKSLLYTWDMYIWTKLWSYPSNLIGKASSHGGLQAYYYQLSANWIFSLWYLVLIKSGSLNWIWSTKILGQFKTRIHKN